MRIGRTNGYVLAGLVGASLAAGCVSEGDLLQGPELSREPPAATGPEAPQRPDPAAELARLVEAAQPTRTEEAGVTVIRGATPPQLAALTAPVPAATDARPAPLTRVEPRPSGPAVGGSLVAAALHREGGATPAAAPGALATPEQLAALRAQPAVPVTVAALDEPPVGLDAPATVSDVSPAVGEATVTVLTQAEEPVDPIVEQVQRLATMRPVSIRELEARGAARLSSDEIRALSVGNTVTHTNADTGFSIATYFDPSGESRLINAGRALPSRYQISDGARCRIDSQGIGVCALLYREGDTTWVCDQRDGGMCNWYVSRIEPGLVGG